MPEVTHHMAPMAEPDCLSAEGSRRRWDRAMLGQGDREWSTGVGPTFPFIIEKEGRLDREAQTPTHRRELRRAPGGGQWGAKGPLSAGALRSAWALKEVPL